MLEVSHRQLLIEMQEARNGPYTTAELARLAGWAIAETQRRLAELEAEGLVARSPATSYPTFDLTTQGRRSLPF